MLSAFFADESFVLVFRPVFNLWRKKLPTFMQTQLE